ncbi:aminotransferase class I/II-fold pyridoxal phosphate-dependent enzyme [Mycobacterium haemophilum]
MSKLNIRERAQRDARLRIMRGHTTSNSTLPFFRIMESAVGATAVIDGKSRIMLGSNNYLGLQGDSRLIEAANRATNLYGPSCSGTPPFCGMFRVKAELEELLADWHLTQAALAYNSGYQANVAAITALLGAADLAFADSDAHASIQNGIRLSGASTRFFAHNDLKSLEQNLDRTANHTGAKLIAIDGLYSMQGGVAPMAGISSLAKKYNAGILVDEAHSVGIFGPQRTGIAEEFGCSWDMDVLMGALSKGLASTGGYIVGSRDLIDLLRLHSSSHTFSTTVPPSAMAAGIAAIKIVRSAEGEQRAAAALANARALRDGFLSHGLEVSGEVVRADGTRAVAPNIAVRIGLEQHAIAAWNHAFDNGVYCALALAPAVGENDALLRCSVAATHSRDDIERAVDVIATAVRNVRD